MEKKARKLREGQKKALKALEDNPGNRYDLDGDMKKDDEY